MYTKVFFFGIGRSEVKGFYFLAENFQGDAAERECGRMSRLMDLSEKVFFEQ
jgi:hypothetical protein